MADDAPALQRPMGLRLATLACALAVVALVGIRALNGANVFPPVPKDATLAPRLATERSHVREVRIPAGDGIELYGWVQGPDSAPRKIIQFMGNAEYVGPSAALYAQTAAQLNAQFLLFDYRGFANSAGKTTEHGLYSDADAAWTFATGTLGWKPSQITLWGRSLGGGPATWLAARQLKAGAAPAALILESPFASIPAMARELMPWLIKPEWLCYSLFDNIGRAPELKLPVFQFHGEHDEIIPFGQGQQLHGALPGPKRWLALNCGHNNIWDDSGRASSIRAAMAEFLAEHGA